MSGPRLRDEEGTIIRVGDRVQLVNGPSDLLRDLYGTVQRFRRPMGTALVKWDDGETFEAPGGQLLVVSR